MSDASSDRVVLFTDREFSGASQELAPGRYDVGDLTIGDDAVSSLRVPLGWSVVLFSDPGFTGTSTIYHASVGYVGDELNDQISSVLVREAATIVRGYATDDPDLSYQVAGPTTSVNTPVQSYDAGGNLQTVAVPGGDSSPTLTGNIGRASGEAVGSYAMTQGSLAANNYTINFISAPFTIDPASITIK